MIAQLEHVGRDLMARVRRVVCRLSYVNVFKGPVYPKPYRYDSCYKDTETTLDPASEPESKQGACPHSRASKPLCVGRSGILKGACAPPGPNSAVTSFKHIADQRGPSLQLRRI